MDSFPHADLFILIASLIITAFVAWFVKDFALQYTAAKLNARVMSAMFPVAQDFDDEGIDEHVESTVGMVNPHANPKFW